MKKTYKKERRKIKKKYTGLDEVISEMKKVGIGVYYCNKGRISLCSYAKKMPEETLWKSQQVKELRRFTESAIIEYLKDEEVSHLRLLGTRTIPEGYIEFVWKLLPDGDYIKRNATHETGYWSYGIQIMMSPDVEKEEAISVLKQTIEVIERDDVYDSIRNKILEKDEKSRNKNDEQRKLKKLLKQGSTINEINKHLKKHKLELFGGYLHCVPKEGEEGK